MAETRLKLAVFDCDGTLVDSVHSIVAAMHEACEKMAVEKPEPAAIRRMIGLPLIDVVTALVPGDDEAFHWQLRNHYADAFQRMRAEGVLQEPLYPDAKASIETLNEDGWLLGVATGKSRRGLDATLARHGLSHHFITLQTADRAQGKPHPEMLHSAMADAGVEAHATIMIGDTTFDMEMARNAGVRGVGVSWGYHDPDDLLSAGGTCVVDDFPALMEILSRMGNEHGQTVL